MIVELRTTTLKARTTPKFEAAYAAALSAGGLPHLRAFWKTLSGRLNQVIELMAYDDLAQRAAVTKMSPSLAGWPAEACAFIEDQESRLVVPAPFSPSLSPSQLGGFLEMRIYTFAPGTMSNEIASWGELMDRRVKFSPLVLAGHTEIGPLNEWIHIWAYQDMKQRDELRKAANAAGAWPPKTFPVLQRNCFLEPASFSPIR